MFELKYELYEVSLIETKLKTIKKSELSNKALWTSPYNEITVYKMPGTSSEKNNALDNQYRAIRLGIVDGTGDLYFWEADVLHSGVSQALKEPFILNLTWTKGKKYVKVSASGYMTSKMLKKYLEKDPDIKKGIKYMKDFLPLVTYLDFEGEKIEF